MTILCPGSDSYSNFFSVNRHGPTPVVSFLRTLIVLIIEIARSPLSTLMRQECEGECDKEIIGPDFTNFTVRIRLRPANPLVGRPAMWTCLINVQVDATVKCVEPTVIEANDEELVGELLALLRDDDPKKGYDDAKKG